MSIRNSQSQHSRITATDKQFFLKQQTKKTEIILLVEFKRYIQTSDQIWVLIT